MRFLLLLLIALLKFGTLKTEPIDYDRKNDQLFPARLGKPKEMVEPPAAVMQMEGPATGDWPNESSLRKSINVEDIANLDYENEVLDIPEEQLRSELVRDAESVRLSSYLVKLLQRPGEWEPPLVLIKDNDNTLDERLFEERALGLPGLQAISKRSRYYRAWPGHKRQGRYRSADYDNYNPCTPSKDEVYKLLRALHEARNGDRQRTVNFCNRLRPASAVLTNIRFLGRRRK